MFTKTVASNDDKFPASFALKNKNKFWHSPPSGNLVKTRFGAILVYLEKKEAEEMSANSLNFQ